jgi:hypothetical protein
MLTKEEREKCSWLYHLFTGETIETYQWSDAAVASLYEMVRQIKHCSFGIAFIPTVPPKTFDPARYLVDYVVDVIKKQADLVLSKTTVITPCQNVGVLLWKKQIKIDVMGIGG